MGLDLERAPKQGGARELASGPQDIGGALRLGPVGLVTAHAGSDVVGVLGVLAHRCQLLGLGRAGSPPGSGGRTARALGPGA